MSEIIEFIKFRNIPRYSRDIIITEKIDGMCCCVYISASKEIYVGNKTKFITPETDKMEGQGFYSFVMRNKEELIETLGEGWHYGEWWGPKVTKTRYPVESNRWSLFNTRRWTNQTKHHCCEIVPTLYQGSWITSAGPAVTVVMRDLLLLGSMACPHFKEPEGVVIYHEASDTYFKKTFKKDEGKGKSRSAHGVRDV